MKCEEIRRKGRPYLAMTKTKVTVTVRALLENSLFFLLLSTSLLSFLFGLPSLCFLLFINRLLSIFSSFLFSPSPLATRCPFIGARIHWLFPSMALLSLAEDKSCGDLDMGFNPYLPRCLSPCGDILETTCFGWTGTPTVLPRLGC